MAQPLRHKDTTLRRLRALALVLPALIFGWLLAPLIVSAHAQQVRSDPAPGALVASSPPYIQIEWSEPVSLNFSSIKVYDRERHEQRIGAMGQPAEQDTALKASLAKPLGPGTYTVVWRVVSATDGHVTAGSFAFRIRGTDETSPITPDSTVSSGDVGEDAGPLRWLVRAAILGGAALLVGGALFTFVVVSPTATERGEAGAALKRATASGFAAIGALTAGVLVLALLLDLAGQVAAIRQSDFVAALGDTNSAWKLVSTTLYGTGWVLKLGAAICLFAIMLFVWVRQSSKRVRSGPWPWVLTALAGGCLLLGEAISSHAAAIHSDSAHSPGGGHSEGAGFPLPVVADWVHLVAVSVWIGGIVYMAIVLFPAFRAPGFSTDERKVFLGQALPRFSKLAVASVALIAVTGAYNVLSHTSDLAAMLATAYGQVVAVKVAAFIVLVGVGAANLLKISPMLKMQSSREGVDTAKRLQRNISLEVALSVVALLCAGGLTLLPPPISTANASTDAAAVSKPLASSATDIVGGYSLTLSVQPSASGDKLTLTVERGSGASSPLTDVLKVLFRVRPLDVGSGNTAYIAEQLGAPTASKGAWQIAQPILSINGGYMVACVVERTQSPDLQAAFRLDLSDTSLTAAPAAVETPGP